jgi:hypothetical protein
MASTYFKGTVIVITVLIMFAINYYDEFFSKERIVLCGGNKKLIFIHKYENNYTLYSEGDPKRTLECISEGIPFYKRELSFKSEDLKLSQIINKRYKLKDSDEQNKSNSIVASTNNYSYIVNVNNERYIVFMKPLKTNFNIKKITERGNMTKAFFLGDENTTETILLSRFLKHKNIVSTTIEDGSTVKIDLN